MAIKIKFIAVGNGRVSWETTLETLTFSALAKEVRDNTAIISSELSFSYSKKLGLGEILIGEDVIGTWRMIEV